MQMNSDLSLTSTECSWHHYVWWRLFLVLCMLSLIQGSIAQAEFLSGWTYRKLINVKQDNVDSTISGFPLLVKFSEDLDIGGYARATGYDIRFTDSDGTTLLPFEREYFSISSASASGTFWVRVPAISPSTGASIYIYSGNSLAADASSPSSVWDTAYKAIWHLSDAGIRNRRALP
mgnify:CR=1 FL=1